MAKIVKVVPISPNIIINSQATSYENWWISHHWKYESANWPSSGVSIYLEASMKVDNAAYTGTVALVKTDGTEIATITTNSTTPVRVRSASPITLTNGTEYETYWKISNALGTLTIYSIRLVILIDNATPSPLQTDIEVGCYDYEGVSETTYTAHGDHPHWKYDTNEFNGISAFYLDSMLVVDSGMTIYNCLWDVTSNAMVTGSEISTTSTNIVRVRSSDFKANMVNGHTYEVRYKISGSGGSGYLGPMHLVVLQTSPTKTTCYMSEGCLLGTSSITFVTLYTRWYYNTAEWSVGSIQQYFESSAHNSAAYNGEVDIHDGASSLATLTFTTTEVALVRSSALNISSTKTLDTRYRSTNAGNQLSKENSFFVIMTTFGAVQWGAASITSAATVTAVAKPTRFVKAAIPSIASSTIAAKLVKFVASAIPSTATCAATAYIAPHYASASITAGSTIACVAKCVAKGAASIAATATQAVAATRYAYGQSAITSGATLTATAYIEPHYVSASIAAASTLTCVASIAPHYASASIVAIATQAAIATRYAYGQSAIASGAALVGTAYIEPHYASASIICSSSLASMAVRVQSMAASLQCAGTASAAATRYVTMSAALSSVSALAAIGVRNVYGQSSIPALSDVVAKASNIAQGKAAIDVVATLIATAEEGAIKYGAAAISCQSTVTASGVVVFTPQYLNAYAAMGLATVVAAATSGQVYYGAASIASVATVNAAAYIEPHYVSASITSNAALTSQAMASRFVAALISSVAMEAAIATRYAYGISVIPSTTLVSTISYVCAWPKASIAATATLTATAMGGAVKYGAASIQSTATVAAIAQRTAFVQGVIASIAGQVTRGWLVTHGQAIISTTATLTATAVGGAVRYGAASITSNATLIAIGVGYKRASAALMANTTVTTKVSPILAGRATIGVGTVVVIDTMCLYHAKSNILGIAALACVGTLLEKVPPPPPPLIADVWNHEYQVGDIGDWTALLGNTDTSTGAIGDGRADMDNSETSLDFMGE